MHRPSFAFLLLIVTVPLHAAMYKWTDENGKVVYSQSPPPQGKAEKIKPPPQPVESSSAAQKKLQDQLQRLEDRREDRHLEGEKITKEKKKVKEDKAKCDKVKADLAALSGGPNRLFRNADGNYQRMTTEEREKRIDDRKKYIAENCK